MKRVIFIISIFLIGCSPLEVSRLLGVGTKPFKQQGKAYSKVFDKDFFSCYEQITRELKEMRVSFYRGSRNKGFIVAIHFNGVFPQCNESTEVAIFFTELSKFKTRVETASLNYALAEFVASRLFADTSLQNE